MIKNRHELSKKFPSVYRWLLKNKSALLDEILPRPRSNYGEADKHGTKVINFLKNKINNGDMNKLRDLVGCDYNADSFFNKILPGAGFDPRFINSVLQDKEVHANIKNYINRYSGV